MKAGKPEMLMNVKNAVVKKRSAVFENTSFHLCPRLK
jgi:hypothetical protein